MKQAQQINNQTDIAKRRAEIAQDLRLTKEYWLRSIQPYIVGRSLTDWREFLFVRHAHWLFDEAYKKSQEWNKVCEERQDNAYLPVTLDLDAGNFKAPIVPDTMHGNHLKPESLATIAACLVHDKAKKLSHSEAIQTAHRLIMAAEQYIETLPEKNFGDNVDPDFPNMGMAYTRITFSEIEASNKKDSGMVPFLPPVQQKKKGKVAAEIIEQPLSRPAIKAAVKKFFKTNTPNISKDDDADCFKNDQISLQDLCTLRHDRFKSTSLYQQYRAVTRGKNKQAKLTDTQPMSATSS